MKYCYQDKWSGLLISEGILWDSNIFLKKTHTLFYLSTRREWCLIQVNRSLLIAKKQKKYERSVKYPVSAHQKIKPRDKEKKIEEILWPCLGIEDIRNKGVLLLIEVWPLNFLIEYWKS